MLGVTDGASWLATSLPLLQEINLQRRYRTLIGTGALGGDISSAAAFDSAQALTDGTARSDGVCVQRSHGARSRPKTAWYGRCPAGG